MGSCCDRSRSFTFTTTGRFTWALRYARFHTPASPSSVLPDGQRVDKRRADGTSDGRVWTDHGRTNNAAAMALSAGLHYPSTLTPISPTFASPPHHTTHLTSLRSFITGFPLLSLHFGMLRIASRFAFSFVFTSFTAFWFLPFRALLSALSPLPLLHLRWLLCPGVLHCLIAGYVFPRSCLLIRYVRFCYRFVDRCDVSGSFTPSLRNR